MGRDLGNQGEGEEDYQHNHILSENSAVKPNIVYASKKYLKRNQIKPLGWALIYFRHMPLNLNTYINRETSKGPRGRF